MLSAVWRHSKDFCQRLHTQVTRETSCFVLFVLGFCLSRTPSFTFPLQNEKRCSNLIFGNAHTQTASIEVYIDLVIKIFHHMNILIINTWRPTDVFFHLLYHPAQMCGVRKCSGSRLFIFASLSYDPLEFKFCLSLSVFVVPVTLRERFPVSVLLWSVYILIIFPLLPVFMLPTQLLLIEFIQLPPSSLW